MELQRGQFKVSLWVRLVKDDGGVWREIEGTLSELPSERAVDETPTDDAADELAARRAARKLG